MALYTGIYDSEWVGVDFTPKQELFDFHIIRTKKTATDAKCQLFALRLQVKAIFLALRTILNSIFQNVILYLFCYSFHCFIVLGKLKASLDVEIAQLYLLFQNVSKAKEHILSATEILGLHYELIGMMGKRTKYQEKDLAQLSIKVKVESKDALVERFEVQTTIVPQDIPLNDDLRLNKIEFSGNIEENIMITHLEQKLLLIIVQEMLVSKPVDELQTEEMQPFINFLLSQKNTYGVRMVTLLLRCKFEIKHRRTIERSLLQCEEILKFWKTKNCHYIERIVDVFGVGIPPIWKIDTQYADLLLSIGLVKNALDIYLKIKLWEEVIVCYTILKLRHKAAEVIKEQLNVKPTIKLWCLLGKYFLLFYKKHLLMFTI